MPVVRFSEYFNIKKSQAELDFVDIPLNTDIELYVDPYAISLENDNWFKYCNNLILDYFEHLIYELKRNNWSNAFKLMSNLKEPNETRLGLSQGLPSGKGFGGKYANYLFQRLKNSKAIKTGKLKDISDFELHIPGISSDRISDMTINIIRMMLVIYTTEQCKLHNIETQETQSGMYWDKDNGFWKNNYVRLPIYNGNKIILVPKTAVRYRISPDHREYYSKFVLN